MKRWLAIVGFCVFLIPCAYGETINYDDGDKYVGDVSNGLKHGHGTYFHVHGTKYIGEWKDDYEWNGIQYYVDGTVEGTFSNGEWISK